jgi:hypothetical protein
MRRWVNALGKTEVIASSRDGLKEAGAEDVVALILGKIKF